MFELPEYIVLARQMNETLQGKVIQKGELGNSPHKFVWYNRSHEEFTELTKGLRVGEARPKGRWLSVPLEPGYVLLFGENGGKMLIHQPGEKLPKKYHLYLTFEDESFFTATTQMWGAYELYEKGKEQEREYVKDMRTTPAEDGFTYAYFDTMLDGLIAGKKRSVKSLLTQEQVIPGLGNAIAQDILFHAGLSPRHPLADLDGKQRQRLYGVIIETIAAIVAQGGRYDEYDLYGKRGGYVRIMDKNAVGRSCPRCGGEVKKVQYLGGACYFCQDCQL